jgi:hypothetical protein
VSPSSLRSKQHLHADAHAEEGLVRARVQHRAPRPRFAQLAHAVGHRALPRQHDAVGGATTSGRSVTIVDDRLGRDVRERLRTERRLPMP